MESLPVHYYGGSRLFEPLADLCGISVDKINFVLSQFFALALASLFRTVLHPTKTNSSTRHMFGLIFGLFIGYFCFGMQAFHLVGLPVLSYIVIRSQSPEVVQRMVLTLALTYLSCIHLHRQIFDYGSYTLDITGPLMVITQKVTSLAFNIHDGMTANGAELSKNRKLYAVHKLPTALEFFSYSLAFPALMAGPVLFYKDYMDFVDGDNLTLKSSNNNLNGNVDGKTTISMEPSPRAAVIKKVLLSMLCACGFVTFLPAYPIERIKDDDFVERTGLLYKFLYLSVATLLVRFKYYFAWLFADAICNNAGIGFAGYDESGSPKWNRYSNIDILKFEFGTSLRESIEAWNMGTNRWLRIVVYERVNSYATILTYALSAIWHGFYPGYYLTFASGALFTFASRNIRRAFRDYFTHDPKIKFAYDVATSLVTRLVMSYITFTFVLLEFWPSIRLYLYMYLCLHILGLLVLLLVPQVSRPKKSKTSNSLNVSNGNASKISNGSSNSKAMLTNTQQ